MSLSPHDAQRPRVTVAPTREKERTQTMKKIVCILLATLIGLSTVACIATGGGSDTATTTEAEATAAPEDSAVESLPATDVPVTESVSDSLVRETEAPSETMPEDTSAEDTVPDTVAETAPPTSENYTHDLPTDLDYNRASVCILHATSAARGDELVSEGLGNGIVSDAVYTRNQVVEAQLNIVLELVGYAGTEVSVQMGNDIQAGGDAQYDIVVNGTNSSVNPALKGYYRNLSALNNIDTSKGYWTQGYNDLATFTTEHKQYLATSAAALSLFRLTFVTIYNSKMLEDNHLEDLYEVIKRGDWTLDYQYKIADAIYVDEDGDGLRSEGDMYGFVTGNIVSMDPYMVATDQHLIVKDPETMLFSFNTDGVELLPDIVESVQRLTHSNGTYMFSGADKDDVGKDEIINMFARGKTLMATIMFWNMEHSIETLASMSYGIAPIPKYSQSQSYHAYVQDQVSSFGISTAVGSEERQEMLAAVLEALAYHSYEIVRPAYYNNTLSTRFLQDPKSSEILDIIFESLSFDFSSTCSNLLNGLVLRDQLRPIFSGTTNTIASTLKGWSKSAEKALKKINSKMTELSA